MVHQQTRADKPRRALVDDPAGQSPATARRPRKAARTAATPSPRWWRRGLALAAVSGIGITALGVFGASNYSTTGLAFANQATAGTAAAETDRGNGTARSAERPALTFDQLVEQRAKLIAQASEEVTAEVDSSAASNRQDQLAKTAASVEAEAERLRNLDNFLWPTEGGVGSPWGRRLHPILHYYRLHAGADIGGRCGQPIYAAQSGTVTKADMGGYNGGSGNNVRIDHGDILGTHVETAYLHMSKIVVKPGQEVAKGDLIGNVGSTGLSTACHLHLSLYKNGVNSDPLEYVHKPAAKDGEEATKEDENSADRELAAETDPETGN
ncbi:MAG: M23 family metallopeptidase [Propionicimonas sp.]|nr:M23 family metallopeptidase [Propionicimonas sp.]